MNGDYTPQEVIDDEMKFRSWVVVKLTRIESNMPGMAAACQIHEERIAQITRRHDELTDAVYTITEKFNSGRRASTIIGAVVSALVIAVGLVLKF